jgi:hypothetical protein
MIRRCQTAVFGLAVSVGLVLVAGIPAQEIDGEKAAEESLKKQFEKLPEPEIQPDGPPSIEFLDAHLLGFVENDRRVATREENPDEFRAYNLLMLHARKFEPAYLESKARRDVVLAHMIRPTDNARYRGELVYVEGVCGRLRRDLTNSELAKTNGIKHQYEAYIFLPEYKGNNPYIVHCTEIDPRLEPSEKMYTSVRIAAYFFKSYVYRANDKDGKSIGIRSPLLIGGTLRPDRRSSYDAGAMAGQFVWMAIACFAVLGVVALGLTWWFRSSDRKLRAVLAGQRPTNPFPELGNLAATTAEPETPERSLFDEPEASETPVTPVNRLSGLPPTN